MKRWLLLLLLLIPLASASLDDEAKLIYSSKELLIEQVISGGVDIGGITKSLTWVEADFNYFPQNTYRQTIVEETHSPEPTDKSDTNLKFKIKDVTSGFDIKSTYLVRTRNEYKEVKDQIKFPVINLESKYDVYLDETNLIDITKEIKATASTIASGKDDLFEVSMDVANWVVNNIRYDLNTITEDSAQKASWVMKNREGVCDELSILYISLMRSLGIPARFVTGISYSNSDLFEVPWSPHAWAEVYFPGYGWVPFDLTYNQFGFIDASHIQFKATSDVSSILTNYQWKGYDLNKLDIDIKQTNFETTIKENSGVIDQGFDVSLSLINSAVDFGSYNVLKIELHNKKGYYLSSSLNLAMPKEVKTEDYILPVYLKPRETKVLYVLLEVDSDLSNNYVYTMPISIYTTQGNVYETEFKVGSKYSRISLNHVNAYLKDNSPDTSNADVSLSCSFEADSVLVGRNLDVVCIIKNQGNLYLKDGSFCFDLDGKNICDKLTLGISEEKTISKQIQSSVLGNHEVNFRAKFNSVDVSEVYGFLVIDAPSIEVDEIVVPVNFDLGDDVKVIASLNRVSGSIPLQTDLSVSVNDVVYNWDLDSFEQNTDFTIPLSSYLFKEGLNEVLVFVIWEDEDGTQYSVEKTENFVLNDFSLIDSVKSFFYRLMN